MSSRVVTTRGGGNSGTRKGRLLCGTTTSPRWPRNTGYTAVPGGEPPAPPPSQRGRFKTLYLASPRRESSWARSARRNVWTWCWRSTAGLPGRATVHANSARKALVELCTLPLFGWREHLPVKRIWGWRIDLTVVRSRRLEAFGASGAPTGAWLSRRQHATRVEPGRRVAYMGGSAL